MDITKLLFIVAGGIAAGIINTMAGGGTLITYPILLFAGIDPKVALGTNRLSILVQSIIASATFYKNGVSNWKLTLILAVPATISALLGALIASVINNEVFRIIVAIMVLVVLAIIVIDPKKRLKGKNFDFSQDLSDMRKNILGITIFFFIGLYGGFFGAGVGIMMLVGVFLIYDMDFLIGNGVTVPVNLFISVGAVIMFTYKGNVNFYYAIPLSIANGLGGYIGAHLSIKGGHRWIRRVVLAMGVVSVIKLIFFP